MMIFLTNRPSLEGSKVKLVTLNEKHKTDLLKAASDGKLWELWYTSVPSKESIDSYVELALKEQKLGRA